MAIAVSTWLLSDVPWGDHLTLFRDTSIIDGVSLGSLFRFHNEHLIVPTRLVVAADYLLWHGVNVLPHACAVILMLGIVALESWMFHRAKPDLGPARTAFVTALLMAVLVNGRLTWTLTFPILMQHVSANFFIIVMLAAYAMLAAGSAVRRERAWAVTLGAATLAALSSASGIFALPAATVSATALSFLSPALRRGAWRATILTGLVIGLGIVATYVTAHAVATDGHVRAGPHLAQAIRFAIYFPGGAWFRDSTWPIEHHPDPLLLHVGIFGFWALVALVAHRLWLRRDTLGEFELFHVGVLAFVIMTAGVGGLFRADLGSLEALNKKYAPTALLAWASVVSLLMHGRLGWLVSPRAGGTVRPVIVASLVTASILPGDFLEFRAWRVWRDVTEDAAQAYASGVRTRDVLLRFFPIALEAERLMAPIAADGGYCFRRLDAAAAEHVGVQTTLGARCLDRAPDHCDYSLEFINDHREPLGRPPVVISGLEAAAFRGWAVDREASRPAAGLELVVAGQRFLADYGRPRPDVAQHFAEPSFLASGFTCVVPAGILPKGKHEFTLRILLADGQTALETSPASIIVE